MRTGKVVGAEALIRWEKPDSGILSPDEFLPAIQDHPVMIELGEWVIRESLAQMSRWREIGIHVPVSVNVPALQLEHPYFIKRLKYLVSTAPSYQPGSLEIEILETRALKNLDVVSQLIDDCALFGVYFSLDDFGTGYSSLHYLKKLHISQIKLDRSFVSDVLTSIDDFQIMNAVINLAVSMNMNVVAEGIESRDQAISLMHLGCDHMQGYIISRPINSANFPSWYLSWSCDPSYALFYRVKKHDLLLLEAVVIHRSWLSTLAHNVATCNSEGIFDNDFLTILDRWAVDTNQANAQALEVSLLVRSFYMQIIDATRKLSDICVQRNETLIGAYIAIVESLSLRIFDSIADCIHLSTLGHTNPILLSIKQRLELRLLQPSV